MERPILFNTEMVRAILDGRKVQTRRIIKPQPTHPRWNNIGWLGWDDGHGYRMKAPCAVGDVLWVRETWCKGRVEYGEEPDGRNVPYIEQCTGDDSFIPKEWAFRHDVGTEDVVWRPSIHMPRKAARIFLRVTDVRAERLQDITEEEAEREGFKAGCSVITCGPWGIEDDPDEWTAIEDFAGLWDSTIKRADIDRYGWHANPWVWVIEFERMEGYHAAE